MELYENHSDCLTSNLKLSEISILTFSQFYFKINRIQLEIVVSSSKKAKYYYFSLNICKKIFLGFIFFIASTPPPQKKNIRLFIQIIPLPRLAVSERSLTMLLVSPKKIIT